MYTSRKWLGLATVMLIALALGGIAGIHQVRAAVPAAAGTVAGLQFGPAQHINQTVWSAFYDSHKDVYIGTDVSDKSQAAALHINYAPLLAKVGTKALAPMYLVKGTSAAGQIAVYGAEPPDPAYSPLWQEIIVQWKAGAKAVLLTSDNQINGLAKKGTLTKYPTSIVFNAPIVKVTK